MKSKGEGELEIEKIFRKLVKKYNKILGSKGTWSDVLDKLGRKLYGKKFCGVYDQATLPWAKIKRSKCLYGIFNNDYSDNGEHWLSFVVKGKQVYIWDSFGRSIDDIVPELQRQLRGQRIRYRMSDRDSNQKDSQKDCGSRCFSFLECTDTYGIRKAMKI